MPPKSFAHYSPHKLFVEEAWSAAYAANPQLQSMRVHDFGEEEIENQWTSLSDEEKQRYETKIRAGATAHAAYAASQCEAAAHKAPLLRALLRLATGVHTLNMGASLYDATRGQDYAFDSSGLRNISTAWGPTLRVVCLGRPSLGLVTADDIHALLAACPQLAQLHLTWLQLGNCKCCGAAAADALFGPGMAPHAELRSVGLPAVNSGPQLRRFVERLCKRSPKLREIDAESFNASAEEAGAAEYYWGEYRNARCEQLVETAQLAARHGVTRFLCTSYFDGEGGSEGEYGSDGGSVGEYCGDGNVLKHIRLPGGAGAHGKLADVQRTERTTPLSGQLLLTSQLPIIACSCICFLGQRAV